MHRVFDSAGLENDSRIAPCPMLPSAPLNTVGVPEGLISELNGWPACTPVNASPVALQRPTHDSGPVWLASPSPCDSFIHNSLPVFTGATKRFSAKFSSGQWSGMGDFPTFARRPCPHHHYPLRVII
jgi:hypothetical protein